MGNLCCTPVRSPIRRKRNKSLQPERHSEGIELKNLPASTNRPSPTRRLSNRPPLHKDLGLSGPRDLPPSKKRASITVHGASIEVEKAPDRKYSTHNVSQEEDAESRTSQWVLARHGNPRHRKIIIVNDAQNGAEKISLGSTGAFEVNPPQGKAPGDADWI